MTNIEHDQEFELYHHPESLCSQMVRLALAEKNIDWKSHVISLSELELDADNLKPEYLRINPKALVPVLVHNGEPFYDSWTIIDYLDKTSPEIGTALTPAEPDAREKMQFLIKQASLDESVALGSTLGTAMPVFTIPVLRYFLKQQPLLHVWWKYRKHPLTDRRWGARIARILPIPTAMTEKAANAVGNALRDIEAMLAHGEPYLLGDYSQVDIMMTAHFHRLEDAALGDVLRDPRLPGIAGYWRRLQERPSYKKALLDWHDPKMRAGLATVYAEKPTSLITEIRRIAVGR